MGCREPPFPHLGDGIVASSAWFRDPSGHGQELRARVWEGTGVGSVPCHLPLVSLLPAFPFLPALAPGKGDQ